MPRSSHTQNDPHEPLGPELWEKVAKLTLSVSALLLIGYFLSRGGNFAQSKQTPAVLVDSRASAQLSQRFCGVAEPSGRAVPIEMVYSEDKREWIEYAAARFAKLCPNIQVKLRAMEDFSALAAMLDGELHPTIWAPTDELSLRYFQYQAERQKRADGWQIIRRQELVRSPQVLLIWQDRLDVLSSVLREQPSEEGTWVRSMCAGIPRNPAPGSLPREQMVPGRWLELAEPLLMTPAAGAVRRGQSPRVRPVGSEFLPEAAEIEKWGQVKIGHAIPTRFVAGLSAVFLLSYDYVLQPADREALAPSQPLASPDQVAAQTDRLTRAYATRFSDEKDSLRRWLKRCEAGLESEVRPVKELTEGLFAAGPSRYDAVVTYENLTMRFLDKLDATAGSLKKLAVVYPNPTLVAHHPAVQFAAAPAQSDAADKWLSFLLSTEMQHKAIEWGFRPGNPKVSIREYGVEQNRFLRLRRFGILPEPVFHEAPRPDGRLLAELIELWGEATGRN